MKNLLIVLLFLCPFFMLGQWVQQGNTIAGDGGSISGIVDISSDGRTLAVGSVGGGTVKVYKLVEGTWVQVGNDITGSIGAYQGFYEVISLSGDGSTIAIGAQSATYNLPGQGRVQIFKNNNGIWEQMGDDIWGGLRSNAGAAVSLNEDGTVVAYGSAELHNGQSGYASVAKFNGNIWDKDYLGSGDIHSVDGFGGSLAISADGNVVAVGAKGTTSLWSFPGYVKVFKNDSGIWSQYGQTLHGEINGDEFAKVSLSADGTILAVAAAGSDVSGENSGKVKVFKDNAGQWIQLGNDINGVAAGDKTSEISLNASGNILVVGALHHGGNGTDSGLVRVFGFDGTNWNQLGEDIKGHQAGNLVGKVSINASGVTIAIGAMGADGQGNVAGYVGVYRELSEIIPIPDANFYYALVNDIVADFDGDGVYDGDVDTNDDGEIQYREVLEVIGLRVKNKNIESLIGIHEFSNIKYLDCSDNKLEELNINALSELERLICSSNLLEDLTVASNFKLSGINCSSNALKQLNLKNGNDASFLTDATLFDFENNPNLLHVCANEYDVDLVEERVNSYGYTNCTVNSYCTLEPGGTRYKIKGLSRLDVDADGCDTEDLLILMMKLKVENEGVVEEIIGNAVGEYKKVLVSGNYTITPQLENTNYFTVAPNSVTVNFPQENSPHTQDFCITTNGEYKDLEVILLPLGQAKPGGNAKYELIYRNKGTVSMSGEVSLGFDTYKMQIVDVSPSLGIIEGDSMWWPFTSLKPLESRSIILNLKINESNSSNFPVNIGDDLEFKATIKPINIDVSPGDNEFVLNQTVVASTDLNDKYCIEGESITLNKVGDYVHYIIRFENTGTVNAVNVVVKDVIDTNKYDINSLIPISASHSFESRIKGNKTEFYFKDINLPFDGTENVGYVAFKIKTVSSLVVNDTFKNKAEIYFDYNAPLVTNEFETTVVEEVDNSDNSDNSDGSDGSGNSNGVSEELNDVVQIYPVPTNNILSVAVDSGIKNISLFDVRGRLILTVKYLGGPLLAEVDLSSLKGGVYIVKIVTNKKEHLQKIFKK